MDEPLQIIFDNLDHSPAVEQMIREKSENLERFYHHMIDARVIVSKDNARHHKGNEYHVTIEANVPGKRIVVSKSPGRRILGHEELLPTISDAFKAMTRQMEDYSRKQRGDVKFHEMPLEGKVIKIMPFEGYGFIVLTDGREIYFHKNSVVGSGFATLEEGAPVRVVLAYDESPNGPQASTVETIGKMRFVNRVEKVQRAH